MRAVILEGTSGEVGSAIAQILAVNTRGPSSKPKEASSEKEYVTVDFARRCLAREPELPSNLRLVLTMCADASEEGVLRGELRDAIGFGTQQFTGLMGALGKRVANTEGYDDTWFIWNEWDEGAEDYRYWIADSVIEALKKSA